MDFYSRLASVTDLETGRPLFDVATFDVPQVQFLPTCLDYDRLVSVGFPAHLGYVSAYSASSFVLLSDVVAKKNKVGEAELGDESYSETHWTFDGVTWKRDDCGEYRLTFFIKSGSIFAATYHRDDATVKLKHRGWTIPSSLHKGSLCAVPSDPASWCFDTCSRLNDLFTPQVVGYISQNGNTINLHHPVFSFVAQTPKQYSFLVSNFINKLHGSKELLPKAKSLSIFDLFSWDGSAVDKISDILPDDVHVSDKGDHCEIKTQLFGTDWSIKAKDSLTTRALLYGSMFYCFSSANYNDVNHFDFHVWRSDPLPHIKRILDDDPDSESISWMSRVLNTFEVVYEGDEAYAKVKDSLLKFLRFCSIDPGPDIDYDCPWKNLAQLVGRNRRVNRPPAFNDPPGLLYYWDKNVGDPAYPIWEITLQYYDKRVSDYSSSYEAGYDQVASKLLALVRHGESIIPIKRPKGSRKRKVK